MRLFSNVLLTVMMMMSALACSSSGHPAVSDSTSSPPTPPPVLTDDGEGESTPKGPLDTSNGPCPPLTQRECIKSEKVGGRTLCTRTLQICKADGSDWLPCGVISLGSE